MDYPYRTTDYNNPYMDYRRHRTDSKQDDPKRLDRKLDDVIMPDRWLNDVKKSDRWIDDSHRSDQWLDDHPFDRRLADPYLDSGRGFAMGKYNESFTPTTQRYQTYGRPELPSHQNGFYLNEKKVRPETRDVNHGSNVYNEPYSAGKTEKKEKKKKGKFSKICLNFADITSLNGLPFISSSKNAVVKVVWTLLLMAALGAMIFHLYSLFSEFFEYKKHSKINLSFNNLPFPAVTICNVNMMRQSKINQSSVDVQKLIQDADPQKRMALVKKCNETNGDEEDDNFDPGECLEYDPDDTDEEDPEEALYDKQYQGTWEAEGTKSKMYETEQKFREAFNRQPVDLRKQLGHQATDMILQCSFAGKKCEARNFTLAFSETYGNCHTLQYDKFLSRANGPGGGLELTIFLETHEYIPGISNGMGIQLLVHDQGTVPFPDEEGIAISPGTNTFVGIKQVEVNRLPNPYGPCMEVDTFLAKYKRKYTRNTCQKICQQNLIRARCNCSDSLQPELNQLMGNVKNLNICMSSAEQKCVANISMSFDPNDAGCGCDNPCSEKIFEKSISSRRWPSPDFGKILLEGACKNQEDDVCAPLRADEQLLVKNFIKVNIFFQDLNFEQLQENPDYGSTQLLSDIGGSIGLWIGLSVLGLCELLHLAVSILVYICCGRHAKK